MRSGASTRACLFGSKTATKNVEVRKMIVYENEKNDFVCNAGAAWFWVVFLRK
jgi:hypothetical protein